MKTSLILTLLVAVSAAGSAMAAGPTTELKVAGKVQAAACLPAFAGGAVLDYGFIPAETLSSQQYRALETRKVGFSVTCDAAIKMGMKPLDNRSASALPEAAGVTPNKAYGLGMADRAKIGALVLTFNESTIKGDGNAVSRQVSANGGTSWSWNQNEQLSKDLMYSWSQVGSGNPAAFKVVTGEVTVTPYLNKAANLPLTQEINLDGSVSFEITYL